MHTQKYSREVLLEYFVSDHVALAECEVVNVAILRIVGRRAFSPGVVSVFVAARALHIHAIVGK